MDFFEPCVKNNISQNPIWIRTVVSSQGSNDMNQLHTFCSHGLCQQNLFTELQSYPEVLGTLLRLKLLCWAHRTDPRIFAPPAWNDRHLEEQEYFKNKIQAAKFFHISRHKRQQFEMSKIPSSKSRDIFVIICKLEVPIHQRCIEFPCFITLS